MKLNLTLEDIISYLPANTHFQWSKSENDLLKETALIQECVTNNTLAPINNRAEKFLSGDGYKNLLEHIAALRLRLANEYPIELVDQTIALNRNAIVQTLIRRDASNPIRHLVHNASETWFFYSLEMYIDPQMINDEADRWIERERIKRALGIGNNQNEHINRLLGELIDNSVRGGELRIYFRAPLCSLTKENADFNVVHIWGQEVFIAVVNKAFCAGYDITLPINLTIPFVRKDLYFDQAMPYSYIDDLYSKDIEHWNDNTSFVPLVKYMGG
jgi:hypothetical protein